MTDADLVRVMDLLAGTSREPWSVRQTELRQLIPALVGEIRRLRQGEREVLEMRAALRTIHDAASGWVDQ